jgi:hypothetical protein
MAQKDPPHGDSEGLFLCQLTVLRALAKNLARAATKTGLLSSLMSINMKDVSIVSPFFWCILKPLDTSKIHRLFVC